MAKVIKAFPGVPDGATRVRNFEPGDKVDGDLARVALREGWAVADIEPEQEADIEPKQEADVEPKQEAAAGPKPGRKRRAKAKAK